MRSLEAVIRSDRPNYFAEIHLRFLREHRNGSGVESNGVKKDGVEYNCMENHTVENDGGGNGGVENGSV